MCVCLSVCLRGWPALINKGQSDKEKPLDELCMPSPYLKNSLLHYWFMYQIDRLWTNLVKCSVNHTIVSHRLFPTSFSRKLYRYQAGIYYDILKLWLLRWSINRSAGYRTARHSIQCVDSNSTWKPALVSFGTLFLQKKM